MHSIAAIITAPGQAAISAIRISGDDSWQIVSKFVTAELKPAEMKLAWFKNADEKIDQVLVLPFKAPRSYTGEDVIEIHCHGGVYLAKRILSLLLDAGAKLAREGEFTERAFLNQKLDLSQAESVLDLIHSRSKSSGENAVKIYQGYLGEQIHMIRNDLISLMGSVVAGIDFPDEVGDFDSQLFANKIKNAIDKINELLKGEADGRILREGYKVAIVGQPNAGKSSLLNVLLHEQRAIVTDIAGTTRDLIEEQISIEGLPVILLDTAGLRDSEDTVEKIGIERSKKAIEEADLVLHLQDLSDDQVCKIKIPAGVNCIRVGTKKDLVSEGKDLDILISSNTEENISKLKQMIYERAINAAELPVKINQRQADLLRKSKDALAKSLEAADQKHPADFWTIDLKAAIASLGEITGDVLTEELLDEIFSKFCIGK